MHEKIALFLPMAGLYVHIPFCKTRCSYCNFFSTTELDKMGRYVANLGRELELRKDFLPQKNLATLYWGGGTPSLLSFQHAKTIMDHIKSHFSFEPLPEITLEANPDDITEERLTQWGELGFNRLSIGIQSFDDHLLKLVNRRHTAQQRDLALGCLACNGQSATLARAFFDQALLFQFIDTGSIDYVALGAMWRERDGQPLHPVM